MRKLMIAAAFAMLPAAAFAQNTIPQGPNPDAMQPTNLRNETAMTCPAGTTYTTAGCTDTNGVVVVPAGNAAVVTPENNAAVATPENNAAVNNQSEPYKGPNPKAFQAHHNNRLPAGQTQ